MVFSLYALGIAMAISVRAIRREKASIFALLPIWIRSEEHRITTSARGIGRVTDFNSLLSHGRYLSPAIHHDEWQLIDDPQNAYALRDTGKDVYRK